MALSLSNLKKKDNKKIKAIVDWMLYTLPLYLGAIMAMPVPESVKLWLNFGVTILIITLKGASKFSSEEDSQERNREANEQLNEIQKQP